jgi:hypothetical protein
MGKQRTYLGAYSGDDPDFKKAGNNLGWLPTRKPNVYAGTDGFKASIDLSDKLDSDNSRGGFEAYKGGFSGPVK